jgi:hypothetical protein
VRISGPCYGSLLKRSVADGAFLTLGSDIENPNPGFGTENPDSGSGIENSDPRSGRYRYILDHISKCLVLILCFNNIKFLVADPDPGSGVLGDPGWKNSDPEQTSRFRNTA